MSWNDDSQYVKADQYLQNQAEGDRHVAATFFWEEIIDEAASEKEGRPIYQSVEMCEIRVPGDKDNVIRDRVKYMRPDPRKRFPQQYARFKAGEKVQVVGTLLVEWGLIDRATAKSYAAVGIHTVEQLAGLADSNTQGLRGSVADRQKARDFLAMAAGQAPIAQARAENEKLRAEIEALREMVEGMKGGGEVEPPKRRGRPRAAEGSES